MNSREIREFVIPFTTTAADQDIYDVFIKPKLTEVFGYSSDAVDEGTFLEVSVLFDSDYTGDMTINGVVTKAEAKITLRHIGTLTSWLIETNGTAGEIKVVY